MSIPTQPRTIRLQDVAALAGVSVGSASRVINGAANVAPELRARVEQAISALGYRPNHAARALRSRSSRTISCMFSDVTNPLYARAFRGLEEAFRGDGYMLLLGNGLNDAEREADILETFEQRGMDGVIIAPGNERDPRVVAAVRKLRMPVVLYDRDMEAECDAVLFNHARGIRTALEYLFALGHRRVAMALWQMRSRPVRRRIEGYRAAYRAAGIPVPDMILQEPSSTGSAYEDVLRLLQSPEPPTALLAQGTHTLVTALRAIAATGRRVPEDMSVIGIGDTDFAQSHDPPLTVLRTPTELVAQEARTLLLSRMRHPAGAPPLAPRKVLIPYDFVERGSCAPAPAN